MHGIAAKNAAPREAWLCGIGRYNMWRKMIQESLPWSSERIVIDSATGEYAELVYRLNNDDNVRRFLGGPKRTSVEDTREKLNQEPGRLYVIKQEGRPVGYSDFIDNDKTDATDILIVLDPHFQGLGIGKETLCLMLDEFEMRFPNKEVALTTQRGNLRAQSVICAVGFQKTGEYEDILKYHYYVYKRPTDRT